jgi:hypothetical protein
MTKGRLKKGQAVAMYKMVDTWRRRTLGCTDLSRNKGVCCNCLVPMVPSDEVFRALP